MNGYSLLFTVLVIMSIAIIIGTLGLALLGSFRTLTPPWHRHKLRHHRP